MKHSDQKQLKRGKGLFQLTGYHSSLREVRAETQAGSEAEATEEHACYLAYSLAHALLGQWLET